MGGLIFQLQHNLKTIIIKIVLLILIALLYYGRAFNDLTPEPLGDGCEYILTTEALYNHFSPDITAADVQSFKEAHYWNTNVSPLYHYNVFDDIANFLLTDRKFLDEKHGLYTAENGKSYGYHFFFYSLLNVPGRYISDLLKTNPLIIFHVSNATFVFITCVILLFGIQGILHSVIITLCFTFSTPYWYLGWQHTEIYTTCLVTVAMFLYFFKNKTYLPLFLISLGAFQNQPLVILLTFIIIHIIIKRGFSYSNLLRIFFSCFIVLLPSIFYYYHFNSINLIKDSGLLSWDAVTFTRIFGFYFDINQGMILAIPLLLLVYLYSFTRNFFFVSTKRKPFEPDLLLPIFLLSMTCIVSTMTHWNPGQAIVNRYICWFVPIITMHTFYLIKNDPLHYKTLLYHYLFLTQFFTTLYHQQFNIRDYGQFEHTPLAKWLIEYHPKLYNPDPVIFFVRTKKSNISPDKSPVIYYTEKKVCKLLIHKAYLNNLLLYGVSQKDIEEFRKNLNYINGWAYINRWDFKTDYSVSQIAEIYNRF